MENLKNIFSPEKIFLDIIFEEKNNTVFLKDKLMNTSLFIHFEQLLKLFPDNLGAISKKSLLIFYNELRKNFDKIHDLPWDMHSNEIINDLISVFINKTIKKDQTLDISDITKSFYISYQSQGTIISKYSDWLGRYMSGGYIMADTAHSSTGYYMQGGTINVRNTSDGAGCHMAGGTINVNIAGDNLGKSMHKGTIIANSANNKVGNEMDGGTIYVGSLLSIADNAPKTKIFTYNERRSQYMSINDLESGNIKNRTINDNKDILMFTQKEEGLIIVDNDQKKTDEYSDHLNELNMKAGIVVFKKCPTKNIGENQSGGMIIIEDKEILDLDKSINEKDIDEAKEKVLKRISPNRTGGFIALRVPILGYDNSRLEIIETF